MGDLGFWIFISALIVGGMWLDWQKKAAKHETLRRIVEKTGTVDEAKLRELFSDEPTAAKPGYAYRGLRIAGTIIMFISAVPAIFGTMGLFSMMLGSSRLPEPARPDFVVGALMIAASILVVGLGVFFSSRFAEPPPASCNDAPAG